MTLDDFLKGVPDVTVLVPRGEVRVAGVVHQAAGWSAEQVPPGTIPRLLAIIDAQRAELVAAEHLIELIRFPMIQLTPDEEREHQEAWDDFGGNAAIAARFEAGEI